jgi:glycosyltransferase involved in cell wall biosynthesis
VLVVSSANYLGGGEVAIARVLERLQPRRFRASVAILAHDGGEWEHELARLGVASRVLRTGRFRELHRTSAAILGLARLARGADLVHVNDMKAAVHYQLAHPLVRRPWLYHVRDLLSGANVFERLVRWVRPARLLAISDAVRQQALIHAPAWANVPWDVVRHGIDAAALASQADRGAFRAAFGLRADDLAVGIVGRLMPWKGQEDFLRAAALIAPRVPTARFFVVGGLVADAVTTARLGDEAGRLERLAGALGVGDRVVFTGVRQDVPSVMAGLDVLVLASRGEPFGLVLLEAMAQGTAVVATSAGGPPEVIEPEVSGLLVTPGSPRELARAIERLLLDAALRRRIARGGYAHVRLAFTLEREALETQAVWDRLQPAARLGVHRSLTGGH